MLCPHCHAPNADDARFCGVCGKATSSTEPVTMASMVEGPVMIGREIGGRYRILAKLGEGGMGTVYRAEQVSLKRTVAVKLLRPDMSNSGLLLRRFNAEAEVVAKLSHPNTVNIYDFGQDTDGTLFIAMEFIEGRSLRSVIHAEAPLPVRRALAIASQVAASLTDAHAHSIIHRDLKPDNVMLQDRGRMRDVVRVLDFGIAKLRDDSRATQQMQMTQAGDMLGTPQYMAPEQIRAEPIDGRTDVYALGCMLYEMVTGRLPFEAPTVMALLSKHLQEQAPPPTQRRPDLQLPPAIDALVMSGMAKDPRARPPTMEHYGEQIAALLATLPSDSLATGSHAPMSSRIETPAASWAQSPTSPPPGAASFAPSSPPPAGSPQIPTPPPPQYTPMPMNAASSYAAQTTSTTGGPKSSNAILWVVFGVAMLGLACYAVYVYANKQTADYLNDGGLYVPPVEPDDHDDPPDPPDPPDPDPDRTDPWAGGAPPSNPPPPEPAPPSPAAPSVPGEIVEVGQGVRFVVPAGFVHTLNSEGMVAMDTSRGIVIMMAPFTESTNDPRQLAQAYAKTTGLTLTGVTQEKIAGAVRPIAAFEGTANGIAIRHVVVAYLGPSYRIALVIHVPQAIASDPEVMRFADEVGERRVLLPSS